MRSIKNERVGSGGVKSSKVQRVVNSERVKDTCCFERNERMKGTFEGGVARLVGAG